MAITRERVMRRNQQVRWLQTRTTVRGQSHTDLLQRPSLQTSALRHHDRSPRDQWTYGTRWGWYSQTIPYPLRKDPGACQSKVLVVPTAFVRWMIYWWQSLLRRGSNLINFSTGSECQREYDETPLPCGYCTKRCNHLQAFSCTYIFRTERRCAVALSYIIASRKQSATIFSRSFTICLPNSCDYSPSPKATLSSKIHE